MKSIKISFSDEEVNFLKLHCTSLSVDFQNEMDFDEDIMSDINEICVDLEIYYSYDEKEKSNYSTAASLVTKITSHPLW